ncbi:MAG: DUF4174 domain-containing protein [Bacteroidota bacterium]
MPICRLLALSGISCLLSLTLSAQDLSNHRWQHRILLVIGEDAQAPYFQQQLQELQSQAAGLTERKLVVYQLTPQAYRQGLEAKSPWAKGNKAYQQYRQNANAFEVVLIGLDGDVKLRRTDLLSCRELFATIDVMPMRRQQLRQKEN